MMKSCFFIATGLLFLLVNDGWAQDDSQESLDRDFCQLEPETGPCRGAYRRWYYDSEEKECKSFTWGGCRGNTNKFGTKAQCESVCKSESGCSPFMCLKYCEFGFLKDSYGCDICACRRQPNSATCPEIECPNSCPHGYRSDANGCTTCSCKDPPTPTCPPVCYMYCQYGNKQDENGCDICECYSKEEVCGPQTCRLHCPAGFVQDARGCDLCECRSAATPVVSCSPMRCRKHCAHGFQKDSFGCDTCVCASAQSPVDCSLRPSCTMYCPYGFRKGADGCNVCRCAGRNNGQHLGRARQVRLHQVNEDQCGERPICRKYCQHGFKKDSQGCNICSCNSEPVAVASPMVVYGGGSPSQLPANIPPPAPMPLPAARSGPRSRRPRLECPSMSRCRKHCAFGFVKDDFGCDMCVCRSAGQSDHCGFRPMCLMHCQYGFKKDSEGCNMCECRDTPDCSLRPMCLMYCQHGFQTGEDGCPVCRCNDAPAAAPVAISLAQTAERSVSLDGDGPEDNCGLRPMCTMYCRHGFVKDKRGCNTCRCKPYPDHCALRPMCRMYCQNGFQTGQDGCPICRCA